MAVLANTRRSEMGRGEIAEDSTHEYAEESSPYWLRLITGTVLMLLIICVCLYISVYS